MKKLLLFIWAWLVSLFEENYIIPVPEPEKETEKTYIPKFFKHNDPQTAPHNNRKRTKSRRIQVMADRVIYHS